MSASPIALVTGFAPFGGEAMNPSWAAARALHAQQISGFHVIASELPVAFQQAADILDALIVEHRPAIVIAIGQAGGRARISLERVALNWCDARIPDNLGQLPRTCQIAPLEPAALFAPFPIDAALERLIAADIPAEVSLSAGAYVCNELYFRLCMTQQQRPDMRAIFMHIPYAPEQIDSAKQSQPSLPVSSAITATRILLQLVSEARSA
jgi:pyroglutamyl-peptidase